VRAEGRHERRAQPAPAAAARTTVPADAVRPGRVARGDGHPNKRRAFWLLTAAVLAGVLSAPAAAAPAPPNARTLILERTTSGPASFSLIVDAQLSDDAREGFIGTVSARVEAGRVVDAVSLGAHAFYWDYGVRADTGEQVVEVCQPTGGCIVNRTLAYQGWTQSSDDGGDDVHNRLYVVIEGPGTIRFTGDGWTLHHRPMTYRWVGSADAEGSGVLTGSTGVHRFESASLRGGPRGSIATGAPPCSRSGSGLVARGAGTATLTGGAEPQSVTCPTSAARPYLTALAAGGTDWSLTGPVIGDNTQANVPLFVLDLPRSK
jgi:hypothetical protein